MIAAEHHNPHQPAPSLWRFGLIILPYGAGAGFVQTTAPFLLSKAGLPVHQIATISTIALCPFFLSFLWAPLVDLGWKRRNAVVLSGFCTAAALALAIIVLASRNLVVFTALVTLSVAFSTFNSAATGGLMATMVRVEERGRAGGCYMVGTLAGAALSAGITLWCAEKFGLVCAAFVLAGLVATPGLLALGISEPESAQVGLRQAASNLRAEIVKAFHSRRWLVAMLCLASPVGPAAAANLLSAIAGEYHVSSEVTILMTGFAGSFLTATGCLLGGVIADRVNRWRALLGAGLAIGIFAMMIAPAPRIAPVFLAGTTLYLFLQGVVNAAYVALLLETVAQTSHSASAQYTWLNNLGNLPVAYMTWLDGQGHRVWGTPGLFAVDGVGTVVPTLLLFWVVARTGVAKMADGADLRAAAAS